MRIVRHLCLALFGWLCLGVPSVLLAEESLFDPISPILKPVLEPSVANVLRTYRNQRKYTDDDFPMSAERFAAFRAELIDRLVETLGMRDWVIRAPKGKKSPIADRFRDRVLQTIQHHDVTMEIHVVEIPETGDKVPMVLCLPKGKGRHPGVCCFSGHTTHGLKDLVLDLDSYQHGMATRLAQAGFASIAVEKIDAGYLSRDFVKGVDENEIATFRLAWGRVTRAHQLMACLAASEILATHPRVDETHIGATGVSLGGWLSVQTATLTDRITAVADFGVKTMMIPDGIEPGEFQGLRDLCHILPGMLSLGDRNLLPLAYCPRPMLAGHGRRDAGSMRDAPLHYRKLYQQQYQELGRSDHYEYHVHDGGDVMPHQTVIDYFRRQFQVGQQPGGANNRVSETKQ